MNKFISFALVVCALAASVQCSSYGSYGGSAGGQASAYNANSYILGAGPVGYAAAAAPAAYAAPAYSAPSYSAPARPSGPKYTVQPAYAHELYPGQHNYRSYHSAPTYSQVALPIVPSSPVAKLYVPAQQSYAAPASSYGGGY